MFPTLSFANSEFSSAQMGARSTKAAGALAAAGIKDGDTIAIMMRNKPALMRSTGISRVKWRSKSDQKTPPKTSESTKKIYHEAHAPQPPQTHHNQTARPP